MHPTETKKQEFGVPRLNRNFDPKRGDDTHPQPEPGGREPKSAKESKNSDGRTYLVPVALWEIDGRRASLDSTTVDHDVDLTAHELERAVEHGPHGGQVSQVADGNFGASAQGPDGVARRGIGFVALHEADIGACARDETRVGVWNESDRNRSVSAVWASPPDLRLRWRDTRAGTCLLLRGRSRTRRRCLRVRTKGKILLMRRWMGYGPRVPPVITAAWPASEKSWGTGTAGVGAVEDIVRMQGQE